MNEDQFNMEVRKFLKKVGVTSQREIEAAVRQALAAGQLSAGDSFKVGMTLTIDRLGVSHQIDGEISVD